VRNKVIVGLLSKCPSGTRQSNWNGALYSYIGGRLNGGTMPLDPELKRRGTGIEATILSLLLLHLGEAFEPRK
jgi:hypothetical protein